VARVWSRICIYAGGYRGAYKKEKAKLEQRSPFITVSASDLRKREEERKGDFHERVTEGGIPITPGASRKEPG